MSCCFCQTLTQKCMEQRWVICCVGDGVQETVEAHAHEGLWHSASDFYLSAAWLISVLKLRFRGLQRHCCICFALSYTNGDGWSERIAMES